MHVDEEETCPAPIPPCGAPPSRRGPCRDRRARAARSCSELFLDRIDAGRSAGERRVHARRRIGLGCVPGRRRGRPCAASRWGPLHGLPITVKDAIVHRGHPVHRRRHRVARLTCPRTDAPAVASLKAAGAVVFGKTNLPAWSGDWQSFNDDVRHHEQPVGARLARPAARRAAPRPRCRAA